MILVSEFGGWTFSGGAGRDSGKLRWRLEGAGRGIIQVLGWGSLGVPPNRRLHECAGRTFRCYPRGEADGVLERPGALLGRILQGIGISALFSATVSVKISRLSISARS